MPGSATSHGGSAERVMLFVDGSNVLIELFRQHGLNLRADRPSDEVLYYGTQCIDRGMGGAFPPYGAVRHRIVRRYWFGSIQGSAEDLAARQTELRRLGYEAVLFHKAKGREEKGVDLAIAREMLIHGFHKNYDTAVLVAGDEDYLGLVQDLKRLGLLVVGMFFEGQALSPRLRVAFDDFHR